MPIKCSVSVSPFRAYASSEYLEFSTLEEITKMTTSPEQDGLDVLAAASNHNALIIDCIKSNILPQLDPETGLVESFLDIGCGRGVVLRQFMSKFRSVLALDANPAVQQHLPLPSSHPDFNFVHSTFEEFASAYPSAKFSFINCSHVLYGYNEEKLKTFIQLMWRALEDKGPSAALVALMAPIGQSHDLHCRFTAQYTHSGLIQSVLKRLGICYRKASATNVMRLQTKEDVVELCRFFASVDCLLNRTSVDQVIEEILPNIICEDGTYELKQEEDYFLIFKE